MNCCETPNARRPQNSDRGVSRTLLLKTGELRTEKSENYSVEGRIGPTALAEVLRNTIVQPDCYSITVVGCAFRCCRYTFASLMNGRSLTDFS